MSRHFSCASMRQAAFDLDQRRHPGRRYVIGPAQTLACECGNAVFVSGIRWEPVPDDEVVARCRKCGREFRQQDIEG